MKRFHVSVLTLFMTSLSAVAQPPALIHYQGRLIDGTNLVNGMVAMAFRIHDDPVVKSVLFEATNWVQVVDGLYSTVIGEYVVQGTLDDALNVPEAWLEVLIDFDPLLPRERITAVPYARTTHQVSGLSIDPVTGSLTMLKEQNSNLAASASAVVSGGLNNLADGLVSVVAGGSDNTAGATWSTVSGGWSNNATGTLATIPGGSENSATEDYTFAAGRRAKANHLGSFVWGDSVNADIASTANNQVTFRAYGGLRLIGGQFQGNAGGLTNFPLALVRNNALAGSGRLALQTNHVVSADWSAALGGRDQTIGVGATHGVIVGGGYHEIQPGVVYATIGGGSNNVVAGNFGVVAGGAGNEASGLGSAVGGGVGNSALGSYATISGGFQNTATGRHAVISGGLSNQVFSRSGVVAGGENHLVAATADYGVVGGGLRNEVSGQISTIAGGLLNQAAGYSAFIGGGQLNDVQDVSDYSGIVGGSNNTIAAHASVIGGGELNRIHTGAAKSVIGGGRFNNLFSGANHGVIAGGGNHEVFSPYGTVGGGLGNRIFTNAFYAVVSGGTLNYINTNSAYAAIGGGVGNEILPGGEAAVIGGGFVNRAGPGATHAVIAGGRGNVVSDDYSVVAGGAFQQALGSYAFMGGGLSNTTDNIYAVVAGGSHNEATHEATTVAGGYFNRATERGAFIGGGENNHASGLHAVVPGGSLNTAAGGNSLAAGYTARALHEGSFVWGDLSTFLTYVDSVNANSWTIRAAGGYRFFTAFDMSLGVSLAPNGTSWAAISDRNAKENFAEIDTADLLRKVAELPVTAWTYKADPDQRRYIGPVAQDFHAAFGLGDDTTISTLDMDGVLISAVKALAEENASLREELDAIKRHLGL